VIIPSFSPSLVTRATCVPTRSSTNAITNSSGVSAGSSPQAASTAAATIAIVFLLFPTVPP